MSNQIPESFMDLIGAPIPAVLTTVMPDGQPHSTVVWILHEDGHLLVSVTRDRKKYKNMVKNPKVTVLAIDTASPYRYLEVRGEVVEMADDPNNILINRLGKAYMGIDNYYGDVVPAEQNETEQRIVVKIKPKHINAH